MRCQYCHAENPEDVQICIICGKTTDISKKPWKSLHNLLWGNKINQDIMDNLNDLNKQKSHFIDVARNLKKSDDD
ncbi:MAG: hypothetical protein LUQ24_09035 [Methanobacterium sp.]|nr:hypothetical protein [Methanobacterium sp.]